jgi:lysozyme
MSEVLKKRIKDHEGYSDRPYFDHLGFATIGYGHRITDKDEFKEGAQYPKEKLLELFEKDFEKALMGCDQLVGHIVELHQEAKNVITEMIFQMGTQGVRNFAKTLLCLEEKDYKGAAREMLDSKWNVQTPKRCQSLAQIMERCN